jgi:hypothetical protein
MNWTGFEPLVLPNVIGAPTPTITLHSKLAAIEFCKRTKCWVRRLEPIATGRSQTIELEADEPGARMFDIEDVEINGLEWPYISSQTGLRRARNGPSGRFCFSEDMRTLTIYPLQPVRSEVIVRVAMTPTLDSEELPQDLEQYAQHIAHGVVASLKRIPGQPFTSSDEANHESMFREQIKTESARLARGAVALGFDRTPPSFL